MPVRNIADKNLRISLSQVDQTDPEALYELALEAREKELLEDARRIVQFLLEIDPDHQAARQFLTARPVS